MNIAVVGLAFTHPYTYTEILHRMGHRVTHVWDDMPARLDEFVAKYGATPVATPEAIPTDQVDGVIATGRIPERVDHAILFLERGLPVYSSKPMATSLEQLDRLLATVRRTGSPLMSTSVLRYAPALLALRKHLEQGRLGTLISVRAVSAHDISMYMREPNRWQDDPQRGGGTIITMGIHAVEPLVVLAGPKIRRVWCCASRRVHAQSFSEDAALITLEWEDGLLGIADVPCGVNTEYFSIELFGSKSSLKCSIPKGDVQDALGTAVGDADAWDEFGYTSTIAAFLDMCHTRAMPIPLEESAAIARVLLAARASARSGKPILLDTFGKGDNQP